MYTFIFTNLYVPTSHIHMSTCFPKKCCKHWKFLARYRLLTIASPHLSQAFRGDCH